tara:strand:- start:483 stop:1844 length:1362 start_codon:yes stop_codon:yes gene_type:complete
MASEIRVDKINSLSGVGTVTLSPTGVDIAGITTAATLRATTGIVTSLTAGSLTSLGAVSGTTGTFSGALSGTTGTFSGAVSGTTGTFSGAVSGTTGTFTGDVDIADKIVHTGDTDTAIRFSGADTITAETAGSERVRITSDGHFGIGDTTPAEILTIRDATPRIRLEDSDTTNAACQFVGDNASVLIQADTAGVVADSTISFAIDGGERLRINSSGQLFLGATSTDHSNRTFITSRNGGNYMSIITDASDNCGITFGDSTSGTGNYESYIAHANSTNDFTIYTSQGAKSFAFKSGGDLSISDGNLVIGTSGHGIDFSAAGNAGGMSSELLDDYEEGTWTLGVAHDAITSEYGRYTKIGRMVYATFEITFGSSSNSGHQYISGLPFTSRASDDNGGNAGGVARDYQNYDIENGPIYHISQGTSVIYFYKNNGQNMAASNTSGYNFRGTAVYTAA